ncbi:MAG: hypothetical protein WD690_20490 [Vicinamibacterales bacterium]
MAMPASSLRFALAGVAWGVGIFGFLRLPWIEANAVLPLTQFQGRVAALGSGSGVLPVDVTLACSGTDLLALCLAAVLAYPARWRSRLAGAAVGVTLILVLNTLRIGTLGRAAGSPALFNLLHLYLWPLILAIAVAAYVFLWMRAEDSGAEHAPATKSVRAGWRFVLLTGAFMLIFAAASAAFLDSSWVGSLAAFIAQAGAFALGVVGVAATADGDILMTTRGRFQVTQECIVTPLIPVYFAAVAAYAGTWRRAGPAIIAVVPLFIALGVVRLLVVALPATIVASPLFFVHAFYQLLTAAVVIVLAAFWRRDAPADWRRAAAGLVLGAACLYLIGIPIARALAARPFPPDPQGVLALLPAFQLALFAALWFVLPPRRWLPLAIGVAALAASQAALVAAVHAFDGLTLRAAYVPAVRAWALAAPLMAIAIARIHDPHRA